MRRQWQDGPLGGLGSAMHGELVNRFPARPETMAGLFNRPSECAAAGGRAKKLAHAQPGGPLASRAAP
jgi:hypothetical protein